MSLIFIKSLRDCTTNLSSIRNCTCILKLNHRVHICLKCGSQHLAVTAYSSNLHDIFISYIRIREKVIRTGIDI